MTLKTCFVIGPIDKEDSNVRRAADNLIEHVLIEPLNARGFDKPARADMLSTPGLITHEIVKHLESADLVVADLRFDKPNVYYELAFRHLTRKAVICFRSPGQVIPFDLNDVRIKEVDVDNVESTHRARDWISDSLQKLPVPGEAESPLSVVLDRITMDKSGADKRIISHIDQRLARILTCSELAAASKNQVIYSTANAMWEAAESALEQVVDELQNTEGECAKYCLERVQQIEEVLLRFRREPYVDQNLYANP